MRRAGPSYFISFPVRNPNKLPNTFTEVRAAECAERLNDKDNVNDNNNDDDNDNDNDNDNANDNDNDSSNSRNSSSPWFRPQAQQRQRPGPEGEHDAGGERGLCCGL